jgi:hypothetical protein
LSILKGMALTILIRMRQIQRGAINELGTGST